MGFRRRPVLLLLLSLGLMSISIALFYLHCPTLICSKPRLQLIAQNAWPELSDDLNLQSLRLALERNLIYLEKLPAERTFDYGVEIVRVDKVIAAQNELLNFLDQNPGLPELRRFLQERFQLLESVSSSCLPWSKKEQPVLFTGYYVPTLRGSLRPDEKYRYPLYKKPNDLVTVDLRKFELQEQVRRLWPWLERLPLGPSLAELSFPVLRGRLSRGGKVVPYYSRAEIDYEEKLKGQNLELIWVDDDVDRFFLHIQGSGLVRLESGKSMMVGYSAANGQRYRSIGGWLIRQGLMRREEVSMPAIRAWIKAHPERIAEIFKVNLSYVFFRQLKTPDAVGCYQVPITAKRSIATDRKVFPGGALAWVATESPLFSSSGALTGWQKYQRLVLNQDTGGAIKGPHRVDLYCGDDRAAELMAGVMKQPGRLFVLMPKTE
ncbi:MltA domain-containing protein [bacterium]|nr:MltA domain-containing protein [bacterium]